MSYPPDVQADLEQLARNLGDIATCTYPDPADLKLLYDDSGSDVCRATLLGFLRLLSSSSLMNAYASALDPQERLAVREGVESSYETWLAWCGASGTTGLPQAPGQSGSTNTGAATLDMDPLEETLPSWYPTPWVANRNLPAHPELDDAPAPAAALAETAMKSRRLR